MGAVYLGASSAKFIEKHSVGLQRPEVAPLRLDTQAMNIPHS